MAPPGAGQNGYRDLMNNDFYEPASPASSPWTHWLAALQTLGQAGKGWYSAELNDETRASQITTAPPEAEERGEA